MKGDEKNQTVLSRSINVNLPRMVDNEIVSRIAQKIRAIRLRKHLTISQLADKARSRSPVLDKDQFTALMSSKTLPKLIPSESEVVEEAILTSV